MKSLKLPLLFVLLSLSACGRFSGKGVELPSTPLLSAGPGWAIVTSSYLRLKDAKGSGGADLAALRDGSLVEIVGRDFEGKDATLWYEIRSVETGGTSPNEVLEGWVPGGELDIYATREQAERALRDRAAR